MNLLEHFQLLLRCGAKILLYVCAHVTSDHNSQQ